MAICEGGGPIVTSGMFGARGVCGGRSAKPTEVGAGGAARFGGAKGED